MSEMNKLLIVIQKLSISKVALANYLNVSRQMVYNYLSMDSIDNWPLDKQIKLLELFDVKNIIELENIVIDSELLNNVNDKLKNNSGASLQASYDKLDARGKNIIEDVIRLCEDTNTQDSVSIMLTLIEHSLISDDYKYLIGYLAKVFKKVDPNSVGDNPNNQIAFEGILFSAFNLYNSGKYSKDKISKVHDQFVKEINNKNDLDSQATNVINITKIIAKKELGISTIDDSNIDLVLEKMVEIQGRKL